jgi:hypothetical protein
MYKYSIRTGLIFGFMSGSLMLSAFLLGFPTRGNPFITYTNLTFIFLHSYLAIYFTKKAKGGEIYFKEAILKSFNSSLFYVFIFSIFTMLYYFYLNPNFAEKYLVDIEISLKNSGLSQAEFQRQMKEWREDFLPMSQLIRFVLGMLTINLILAAVNSVILCKKD